MVAGTAARAAPTMVVVELGVTLVQVEMYLQTDLAVVVVVADHIVVHTAPAVVGAQVHLGRELPVFTQIRLALGVLEEKAVLQDKIHLPVLVIFIVPVGFTVVEVADQEPPHLIT
jgi:hypothetical protein